MEQSLDSNNSSNLGSNEISLRGFMSIEAVETLLAFLFTPEEELSEEELEIKREFKNLGVKAVISPETGEGWSNGGDISQSDWKGI